MGYGGGLDMDTLLSAMKDQALQDTTDLKYLGGCEIIPNLAAAEFVAEPMIYLIPKGSPETVIAEGATSKVKRAVHQVRVVAAVFVSTPAEEDSVVGAGDAIGITTHAQHVLSFFGGNTLGPLTGIDPKNTPTIEIPANGYQSAQVEDDESTGWLNFAECDYLARTLPFEESIR